MRVDADVRRLRQRRARQALFVSAVVYANLVWDEDAWGGETHFVDVGSGVGALVCPRPGRVVLMDQDVTHRVSPPTRAANGRARSSLGVQTRVLPENGAAPPDASLWERGIARAEWGPPSPIGSAAKLAAIVNARARATKTGGVKRDREEE